MGNTTSGYIPVKNHPLTKSKVKGYIETVSGSSDTFKVPNYHDNIPMLTQFFIVGDVAMGKKLIFNVVKTESGQSVLYDRLDDLDERLARMSKEELSKEIMSLRGAWASRDDLGENWLRDMREGVDEAWRERLSKLYGDDEIPV